MNHERVVWLDAVKGFAAICVVIAHVANMYYDHGLFKDCAYFFILLSNVMDSFMMPLFFVISGYSFGIAYVEKTKESNYLHGYKIKNARVKNQIVNLTLIYFVWSVVYCLLKQKFSSEVLIKSDMNDILWLSVKAQSLFWYLYVLIICYLAVMAYAKLFKTAKGLIICSVTLSIMQYWITGNGYDVWTIILTSRYLVFFILGIFFSQGKGLKVKSGTAVYALAAIIVGGLIMYAYWNKYMGNTEDSRCIWSDIPGWGVIVPSLIANGVFILFMNTSKLRILPFIGKYSLEIYLIHRYTMMVVKKVFQIIHLRNGYIVTIGNIILTVTGCILCSMIIKRMGLYTLLFKPGGILRERQVK